MTQDNTQSYYPQVEANKFYLMFYKDEIYGIGYAVDIQRVWSNGQQTVLYNYYAFDGTGAVRYNYGWAPDMSWTFVEITKELVDVLLKSKNVTSRRLFSKYL